MSTTTTDLNKILDECKPFIRRSNDVQEEIHKKVRRNGRYEKVCRYELIYCFYDGLSNNFYHLLVRVCKCSARFVDRSYWLQDATKGKEISDIQEEGVELHINKHDSTRDCCFVEDTNPDDVNEETYLLKKRFCQCARLVPSYMR